MTELLSACVMNYCIQNKAAWLLGKRLRCRQHFFAYRNGLCWKSEAARSSVYNILTVALNQQCPRNIQQSIECVVLGGMFRKFKSRSTAISIYAPNVKFIVNEIKNPAWFKREVLQSMPLFLMRILSNSRAGRRHWRRSIVHCFAVGRSYAHGWLCLFTIGFV